MTAVAPVSLRRKLYSFLNPADGMGRAETSFNVLLALLILTNVVLTVVGTMPEVARQYGAALRTFDLACAAVFALEYLARLYVVPERPDSRGVGTGQAYLRYALSPLPLIDLLVIVSMVLPHTSTLASLRGLRLLKLLSLLRLGRYSHSLQLIGRVIQQRAGELLTIMLIVVVLVFIAASVLYQVESSAGTKGFESIPNALWWAVVTLTTTGYGDVFPVTPLGKLAAGFIMLFGVGMVALPAGMIASGFAEELARLRIKENDIHTEQIVAAAVQGAYCPHCGTRLKASAEPVKPELAAKEAGTQS
ncbi:ion transporter [Deinococcus sp. QL22]|uniref:ion transporter n=1 Tax=Deinococcus sp. QL22 TaxID=2939437 RepID=UPI002017138A|nr:ion transporter [Deinococcus sp. QL22]UQN06689.1 ion transporter [Deinococcus sp. QL22]